MLASDLACCVPSCNDFVSLVIGRGLNHALTARQGCVSFMCILAQNLEDRPSISAQRGHTVAWPRLYVVS